MENNGVGVRKGAWTIEEDALLKKCIEKYGEGKWHLIPKRAGLNRCRKSCRLRWLNYLRPNIKRGHFARDEIDLMARLHKLLGNRWSLIAGRLPGRTANDVKNFWKTHIEKNRIMTTTIAGRQTESDKTITKHKILRPRPISFAKKLQVLSCSKTNDESPYKEKVQQPSLSQDQETNDWTTSDECLRWCNNLLEESTEERINPLNLVSGQEQDHDNKLKEPALNQDGLGGGFSFSDANFWDF